MYYHYFAGQFSLPNDKRQFYEFDIRVPLMVRGPGVKSGQTRKDLVLNIDLAPTFLDLAGITPPDDMDGQSFKSALFQPSPANAIRTDFLVEHTGEYNRKQPGCPQYNNQPLNVSVVFNHVVTKKCICNSYYISPKGY